MLLKQGLHNLLRTPLYTGQYYYDCLDDIQKTVYKRLASGIKSFNIEIELPMRPVNEIFMVFESVLLDSPLLFYVSSFSYVNDLYKSKIIIQPEYKYKRKDVKQIEVEILKYLTAFDGIKSRSDIDKEIYVHDYCLNNFKYDYSFGNYSSSVLGLVLNKTAVCEGIAKFVKLSLDYLGMKSIVVFGKATDPLGNTENDRHAWNIVFVDGNAYHLDVTFDMTLTNKTNRYDYFNLTDEDIKKDHLIINDIPVCTTVGNDFMSINSLVAYNSTQLGKIIENCLMHGKKNIIAKVKNVNDLEGIIDKVATIAKEQYWFLYRCNPVFDISCNQSQLVFEINFI
jgi:hypothetical protein